MLKSLRIQNFRCFSDHVIPIHASTVIIGRNNAGKSTVVDALRLVSIVTSRYQALTFRPPPKWSEIPRREIGVAPSLEHIDFNATNLFHRYFDPPAIVTAKFSDDSQVRIYIGPQVALHAVISGGDGHVVKTKSEALSTPLCRVDIMPQVAPLAKSEVILGPDYVRRHLSSSLAPSHFRNQLHLLREHLPNFRALAAETWPGLQVKDLECGDGLPEDTLSLMVRDESFVAEVGTMGHGLQMWLQTMWFLARTGNQSTVILDEPDVYMHPDLQRRLIRYLKGRFPQTIVTTHSIEIVSEVTADELLIIDRKRNNSRFASSLPAVQHVINQIGSAHNVQLARLWNARKCILVEGDDFEIICKASDVLLPTDPNGMATTPNLPIGGWGGWQYAIGSSMFLKNSGGDDINVYCLLDSDYHTENQKLERYKKASEAGVRLHIWKKKEIENYFLVPSAIRRVIHSRLPKGAAPPTEVEIVSEITRLTDMHKDEVFDGLSHEILVEDRALGQGGANKKARQVMDPIWATFQGRLSLVSGKAVLADVSRWSQEKFGVSISTSAIARVMRKEELAVEVHQVVTALVGNTPFLSK